MNRLNRCFLLLKAADYSNGRYTVPLPHVIEMADQLTIESVSVTSPNDSEVIHMSSEAISSNKKERSAQTNSSVGNVVYNIFPELRIPREYTVTTGNPSLLPTILTHASNNNIKLWLDLT